MSFFFAILIVFPLFVSVSSHTLDTNYNTIINNQKLANKYTYIPSEYEHPIHINELETYMNRVNEDFINQIYPILAEKEKYESQLSFRGMNLDFINLTTFYKYEEVNLGNKLPCLFVNQVPASFVFMKKNQPGI